MSYRALIMAGATAVALAALTTSPAQADGVLSTSCAGGWASGNCVAVWRHGVGDPHIRYVPAPSSDGEVAEARHREKLWLALCRPEIQQDRYGVEYYFYRTPGCEFGRYR
jgi:hypothetical protein